MSTTEIDPNVVEYRSFYRLFPFLLSSHIVTFFHRERLKEWGESGEGDMGEKEKEGDGGSGGEAEGGGRRSSIWVGKMGNRFSFIILIF